MMKNRNVDDAITYANRMNCASKDVGQSIVGEATSEQLTNRKVSRNDRQHHSNHHTPAYVGILLRKVG